jgi:two-component system response regulator PilR (NtrC family)
VILKRLAGGAQATTLSTDALRALQSYSFPGNVRELENILERAVAFANDGVIEVTDLALKANPVFAFAATTEQAPAIVAEPVVAPVEPVVVRVTAQPQPAITGDGLPGLPCNLPDHLDQVEREIIRRALAKTQFNRTQAADLLGISFRQLRYRMQRLGVNESDQ